MRIRTLTMLLFVVVAVLFSGMLATTPATANPAAVSTAAGLVSTQPDVKMMTGSLMAVVTKRHIDNSEIPSESVVVTPTESPRMPVLAYSDLILDVALTGSMSNWKEIVFQNSARFGWELRFKEEDLKRQRARDPGDWFRVPITAFDLVQGEANCISIRLIDKGSHKSVVDIPIIGPVGQIGIANPNLLTFTIDVVDRKVYQYNRGDGKIQADPKWGVSAETAHLLLSEEGPWKSSLPDWYLETIRESIRVRPPVEQARDTRRTDPPAERFSSPEPLKRTGQWLNGRNFDVEILYLDSNVKLAIQGNAIVVTSPRVSQTAWRFDESCHNVKIEGRSNKLIVQGWRAGDEGGVTLAIKTGKGWQYDAAQIYIVAK